jgi:hypothetical protein
MVTTGPETPPLLPDQTLHGSCFRIVKRCVRAAALPQKVLCPWVAEWPQFESLCSKGTTELPISSNSRRIV